MAVFSHRSSQPKYTPTRDLRGDARIHTIGCMPWVGREKRPIPEPAHFTEAATHLGEAEECMFCCSPAADIHCISIGTLNRMLETVHSSIDASEAPAYASKMCSEDAC